MFSGMTPKAHGNSLDRANSCAASCCRIESLSCMGHSELVAVALLLTLTLGCLDANFLVIFLQRGKVFAGL